MLRNFDTAAYNIARKDYEKMHRREVRGETDPFDWGQERTDAQRFPPEDELDMRKAVIEQAGIKVHTHVAYSHLDNPPTLMIYVNAWQDRDQPEGIVEVNDRFVSRHSRWTANLTTNPAINRHITIAKISDIRTLPNWQYKLAYIYSKFNDQDFILIPTHVSRGHTLVLDPERDPIASDPIVQELHGPRGALHVSM